MKYCILLINMFIFIFVLAACGNNPQEAETAQRGAKIELVTVHFDENTYNHELIELPSAGGVIQAVAAHENRIYYANIETNSQNTLTLVVTSLNPDGSDIKRIEMQSPGNEVASFNVTDDGNLAFFILNRTPSLQGVGVVAYYIEYDGDGNEIDRKEFGEFSLIENPQSNTFVILNDGRILAVDANKNELRELDLNNRDWGENLALAEGSSRIRNIFSAQASSPYDLLISDDSYLYGYSIENNEQIMLLSWIQLGFSEIFSTQVSILEDERIIVMIGTHNAGGEREAETYILTPVSRNEAPEKITLTMSGISVTPDLLQAAADFNRQNSVYRIEIYEYLNQADFPAGDLTPDILNTVFGQALLRYQVDIMTGNIPDIVVQPLMEMYNRGFLLDLNPFIDADPDINRTDFFPNVLSAFERPDGTMLSISNKFFVQTMISRNETLGHIDVWTPEEMFALIHNTQDMPLPFGARMLRDSFLEMMIRYINVGFIDLDNYEANFDTDEFISLLNTAKLLPTYSDLPPEMMYGEQEIEIQQMQRGQQLLTMANIASPGRYQSYDESFEDSITIGIPTANGGVHIIMPYLEIGIGANTSNAEAAWSFLRGFLLQSAINYGYETIMGDIGFPLRIDLFNELIEDAMTPRTFVNNSGNTVENPREILNAFDGSARIELYAMSNETARSLRTFIDSAVPGGGNIGDELWDAIKGDLEDFYAGVRSAEETARIIQNRAQIWLSEQKLLT